MNLLLFLGAGLFAWLIVSQIIAWLITPSQEEDDVVEAWAAVFLAPPALALVVVDVILARLMRVWRLYWKLLIPWLLVVVSMSLLTACTTSTQDLYSTSIGNRATADALNQQAQLQEQFLTATAQAPIVMITATAAAFEMQQAYAQATSTAGAQTQVAALTGTAQWWTPTPNATQTAEVAQQYWTATALNLQAERAKKTNDLKAFGWYIVGLVVLILSAAAAYVWIKRSAYITQSIDERTGKANPMIEVIQGVSWDIEKATNGMIGTSQKFLAQLPAITADRQDLVTARAQMIDMATRARLPRKLLEAQGLVDPPAQKLLPMTETENAPLMEYPLPEWNTWMQKWKPGQLILGINEKGLLQADLEYNSHFLFAGTTGSWKTRGGVRVLVTCALASGWQVIIAGKDLDYKVFEPHPNAYLVPFSLIDNPTRAVDLLRNVYAEIERRTKVMSRSGYSLWSHTGKSRTMVVVDEFSNLADALEDIDISRRKELWRWARMDTAEARKFGIHMVYALQDPTAQSMDLRIRRNTTPIMFRVKDATSSRTLLNCNGAEMLSARHFLAVMVGLERGAAFAPSDEEISQFLARHPVNTVSDEDDWIEAVVSDTPVKLQEQQPAADTQNSPVQASLAAFVNNLDSKGTKVIELYQVGGMSNSHIAEMVYGHSNGRNVRIVNSIVEQYKQLTTTTTQNVPDFGAVAASSS